MRRSYIKRLKFKAGKVGPDWGATHSQKALAAASSKTPGRPTALGPENPLIRFHERGGRLYARVRDYLHGAGSVVDAFPDYTHHAPFYTTDRDALASDWDAVGGDLWHGLYAALDDCLKLTAEMRDEQTPNQACNKQTAERTAGPDATKRKYAAV
jgi:hypothetical protein